jgi:citrate synthase
MQVNTKITDIKNGQEIIRGEKLSSLITNASFSETIFLLLTGNKPDQDELAVFNAVLVAAIDHGPGTASGQTSRIVASAKNSVHVSVAAGILAMGERHGGAIEGAAKFFVDNKENNISEIISKYKENKKYVPGFGHAVLEVDTRSEKLFEVAKKHNYFKTYCEVANNTHEEINKISSKKLALNIDGSMAAILLDLGFSVDMMKGVFIISRTPGLVAQTIEENKDDIGLRRMSQEDVNYSGK